MMDLDKTLIGLQRIRGKISLYSCSGCGMEHNCDNDCRIIRSAIDQLQTLSAALSTSEAARTDLWKLLASTRQEQAELKAVQQKEAALMQKGGTHEADSG